MLRDGRLADPTLRDELAHGALALAQELEDREPPWFGQSQWQGFYRLDNEAGVFTLAAPGITGRETPSEEK